MEKDSQEKDSQRSDAAGTDTPDRTKGGIIMGTVIGLSVLLAGVFLLGLRSSKETLPDETSPTTQMSTPGAMTEYSPARPSEEIQAPILVDEELTRWHDEHASDIARILAVLLAPPTQDLDLLRIRCRQIAETTPRLDTQPPHAETAEAFSAWLRSLEDAVEYCLQDFQGVPADEAVQLAGASLKYTALFWNDFVNLLTQRVDLTGLPNQP